MTMTICFFQSIDSTLSALARAALALSASVLCSLPSCSALLMIVDVVVTRAGVLAMIFGASGGGTATIRDSVRVRESIGGSFLLVRDHGECVEYCAQIEARRQDRGEPSRILRLSAE